MKNDRIEKLIESMTLDDLCGQLLCFTAPTDIYKGDHSNFEKMLERTKPGGLFVSCADGEEIKNLSKLCNKYTKVPVIISGDTENGPNTVKDCPHHMPKAMAWGACDDPDLIEKGALVTGQICRNSGVHWSYAPVVDINYNKNNPVTNTRAISDSPNQVIKMGAAYIKGLQTDNNVAACCKHFPGDGLDDRNQHFCTSENPLSKRKWMKTYGKVYKKLIKENLASIMVGHIAVPAFQKDEYDENTGYLPATLSYNVITKLLKGKLKFKGCVVSDALSMAGVSAVVDEKELPVRFINAGGDMELFAEESYFDTIKEAVLDGRISMDRIKDAVRRILGLKEFLGLLDSDKKEVAITGDIEEISANIAKKSIKIVKNADNVLPLNLKKGDHVLLCNICYREKTDGNYHSLEYIEKALNERGIETTVLTNTGHRKIEEVYNEKKPKAVLVNSRLSELDSTGSSLRIDWDMIMTFWRGLIFRNPNVVFTSFGDPYKLYELPFLKTYVNAFSSTKESQEAAIGVILGEIEPTAKNPVELKGYFKREVK